MSTELETKVLLISRRYPPSTGGMETLAAQVVSAIEPHTRLKALTWGGTNKALPFVLLKFLVIGLLDVFTRKPDVIHSQDAVTAPLAWLLSKITKRPYTVMIHGLDITYDRLMYQKLILPFVKKSDAVIANSHATAEVADLKGISSDITTVIPLAVEPSQVGVNERHDSEPAILTIGRLVERKGVEWFIRNVLPPLVKTLPTLRYHVVGSGPMEQAIESTIMDLNLTNHVVMHGRVSEDTKNALVSSTPIFVMPNIPIENDMEGFGLVAQEAALAGMTVVASNLEGIKTAIVDKENGYLLEPKDSDAFIELLNSLLGSPDSEFGRRAAKYTREHFSIDSMGRQFTDVFTKARGRCTK